MREIDRRAFNYHFKSIELSSHEVTQIVLCFVKCSRAISRDPDQKQAFLSALEENGKDWEAIASTINRPIEVCQESFNSLKIKLKKEEAKYKKVVMGTGGGPPPSDDDDPLKAVRKLIEPQMDGLYSIYDGDSTLMKQFQESLPEEKRIAPIEEDYLKSLENITTFVVDCNTVITENDGGSTPSTPLQSRAGDKMEIIQKKGTVLINKDLTDNDHGPATSGINTTPSSKSEVRESLSRIDILRKRKASALFNKENNTAEELSTKKSKTANESFKILAEEKLELVKLQKLSLKMEIEHKQKIYEIELDNLMKKKEFNEEMYKKELLLKDLEIKKKQSEL
ncbi:unnamed protein product [Diatraea saccharalis]|uniref:Myb-like domain-containing protein n=1 Tax=Diatraea saccharalis TaxID=40085 RepID=A0A9N9QWF9_9NEOP|nr:unnamed protein product [Diatraea saccharalis]